MSRSRTTPRASPRTATGRTAAELRRRIGLEIRRLRVDAGLSIRTLAFEAHIDPSYLALVEAGAREASLAVLAAIGAVLGADLSVRFFPTTGPRIHDRFQAPIIEALFGVTHPRWKRLPEIPVIRPARGFIDAVLAEPVARVAVATEVHSQIERLEQQLRWAVDKAQSLPSSAEWSVLAPADEPPPRISRLLVLRSTADTRAVARQFEATLAAAYPARTGDAFAALTTPHAAWPGAAVLWARTVGPHATILSRPPRGISLGR
ncbi:MAG TPA: helix-turn-helix transcriptional regulator [Candidatus Limnocylindrales bacterium]|nr:helix-turn-helix transcriptional regulator [Candidatus Limnocylindrales bacterium]